MRSVFKKEIGSRSIKRLKKKKSVLGKNCIEQSLNRNTTKTIPISLN